jgi:hypothetical protein
MRFSWDYWEIDILKITNFDYFAGAQFMKFFNKIGKLLPMNDSKFSVKFNIL